jgi:hypothetical protein
VKAYIGRVEWLPWKFNQVPRGFWSSVDNQRLYLDWIGKEMNITSMQDWEKATSREIETRGGYSLLEYYGGSLIKGTYIQ